MPANFRSGCMGIRAFFRYWGVSMNWRILAKRAAAGLMVVCLWWGGVTSSRTMTSSMLNTAAALAICPASIEASWRFWVLSMQEAATAMESVERRPPDLEV